MTLAPGDLAFALNVFKQNPMAGPDLLMDRVATQAREALVQRDLYQKAREAGDLAGAQIAAENVARIYSKCFGNAAGAARAIRKHLAVDLALTSHPPRRRPA